MSGLPADIFQRDPTGALVRAALEEDAAGKDVTTLACVAEGARGKARLEGRQAGVLAGLGLFAEVFRQVDPAVIVTPVARDGEAVAVGQELAKLEGPLRAILSGERVALNFLQRLSGVASLTRRFVDVVGSGASVLDTRKTTPGWRALERYAVLAGGGVNHRFSLEDAYLIKDNHRAAAGGVSEAVRLAKEANTAGLPLQVEVESLREAELAVKAGADSLLLDNMSPAQMREVASTVGANITLEASGGLNLENAAVVAASGVARLSIGALTHSATALDLSLEVESA